MRRSWTPSRVFSKGMRDVRHTSSRSLVVLAAKKVSQDEVDVHSHFAHSSQHGLTAGVATDRRRAEATRVEVRKRVQGA